MWVIEGFFNGRGVKTRHLLRPNSTTILGRKTLDFLYIPDKTISAHKLGITVASHEEGEPSQTDCVLKLTIKNLSKNGTVEILRSNQSTFGCAHEEELEILPGDQLIVAIKHNIIFEWIPFLVSCPPRTLENQEAVFKALATFGVKRIKGKFIDSTTTHVVMKQVVEPSGSLMSALLVLAFVVDPSWPVALLNAVTGGDSKSPLEIDWDAHFPKETDFEPPFKFHETLGVVPGQPTLRPDPARKTLFHGLTVVAIGHPNDEVFAKIENMVTFMGGTFIEHPIDLNTLSFKDELLALQMFKEDADTRYYRFLESSRLPLLDEAKDSGLFICTHGKFQQDLDDKRKRDELEGIAHKLGQEIILMHDIGLSLLVSDLTLCFEKGRTPGPPAMQSILSQMPASNASASASGSAAAPASAPGDSASLAERQGHSSADDASRVQPVASRSGDAAAAAAAEPVAVEEPVPSSSGVRRPLKRRAHTIRPMEDPWAMLTGDGSEPSASTAADGEGPSSMDVDESTSRSGPSTTSTTRLKRRAPMNRMDDWASSLAVSAASASASREPFEDPQSQAYSRKVYDCIKSRSTQQQLSQWTDSFAPPSSQAIVIDDDEDEVQDFVERSVKRKRKMEEDLHTEKAKRARLEKERKEMEEEARRRRLSEVMEEGRSEEEEDSEARVEAARRGKMPPPPVPTRAINPDGASGAGGTAEGEFELLQVPAKKRARKGAEPDPLDAEFNRLRLVKPRPPPAVAAMQIEDGPPADGRTCRMVVVRVPLYDRQARERQHPPASVDGVRNFKKFKKQQVPRSAPIKLVDPAISDKALVADAWRTKKETQSSSTFSSMRTQSMASSSALATSAPTQKSVASSNRRKRLIRDSDGDDDDGRATRFPAAKRARAAAAAATAEADLSEFGSMASATAAAKDKQKVGRLIVVDSDDENDHEADAQVSSTLARSRSQSVVTTRGQSMATAGNGEDEEQPQPTRRVVQPRATGKSARKALIRDESDSDDSRTGFSSISGSTRRR